MEEINLLPNEAQRIDRIIKEIEDDYDIELILDMIREDADLYKEYEYAKARLYANRKPRETATAKMILINMVCQMSDGTPEQREMIFELFPEFN